MICLFLNWTYQACLFCFGFGWVIELKPMYHYSLTSQNNCLLTAMSIFFFFSLNYILLSLHWRFKKIYKYNPYALAECFRMATCEPKSENQNISAYGVMLFVSGLYFIIIVNFFMFLNQFLIYVQVCDPHLDPIMGLFVRAALSLP